MPRLTELTHPGPLAPQVATWLIGQVKSAAYVDLSNFSVVVPTSAAGRKLQMALARAADERGKGLLLPRLLTPMQLFESPGNEATRVEQLLAWSEVLRVASRAEFPELLGAFPAELDSLEAFRVAAHFSDLSALLTEAALTPDSSEVQVACELESARWDEVAALYRQYREALGKVDPNDSKIAATKYPPKDFGKIVIAGVPDLPLIVRRLLAKLDVEILVARPPGVPGEFDDWGQPRVAFWQSVRIPVPAESLIVTANPALEAEAVWEKWYPGSGLCGADESFKARLIRRFGDGGINAYDPAGVPLLAQEAGRLALAWLVFLRTQAFSDLRRLFESPRVMKWLTSDDPIGLLNSFDRLTEIHLLTTLPDARAYYKNLEAAPEWIETLTARCREFGSHQLREWLVQIFANEQWDETATEAMALRELGEALSEISPLWDESNAAFSELLVQKILEGRRIYPNHPATALELNGWLEVLWMDESELIVSGCVEGSMPDLVIGHSFLPDRARAALGIASNETRFARDAYLLSCILAQRSTGSVQFTLARRGEEGEPRKPSRLLLRCSDDELADRVETLFHLPSTDCPASARQLPFQLKLPEPDQIEPLKSLSATDFSRYLKCPLRFYLQRVLRLEASEPNKRELDPASFGTVMHRILEMFGRDESARESLDELEIRQFVHEEMERQFFARFGRNPGAPLRVQMETMRARLSAFARVQAEEAKQGWRIVETERAFKGDETFKLAEFPIHATLDRIEQNQFTGQWRILDYKSHDKPPEKTHLGGIRKKPPLVEEAAFAEGAWLDLQLPLYRGIFEHQWRDEPSPEVGYFLLPADLSALQIATLPLTDARLEAAFVCARAIANRIRNHVFWPAAVLNPRMDDFASLFLGEDPAALIDPETLAKLS